MFLKLLLGFAGIGGGVATPIVANKIIKNLSSSKFVKVLSETSAWKNFQEKVEESKTNLKVRKALGELIKKECKVFKNPQGLNNGFEELFACKGSNGSKNDFYYLDSQDSFKSSSESYLPKKVVMVNYQEDQDKKNAHLLLTFDSEKEVKWNIAPESGWKYFKNVILSDKCEVKTKLLGGDDLYCQLQNTDGSTFYYSFSVF